MKTIIKTVCCILVINLSALAANYTVKPSGGNYSTIQACASAMSAGDTCTVYAGTYHENVTVSAGTAGNYKTITVNGSDVVNISGGFTLNSHTKLIGNCTVQAIPRPTSDWLLRIQHKQPSQSGGCVRPSERRLDRLYIATTSC